MLAVRSRSDAADARIMSRTSGFDCCALCGKQVKGKGRAKKTIALCFNGEGLPSSADCIRLLGRDYALPDAPALHN